MLEGLSPPLSLRPEEASDDAFLEALYRSTRPDLALLGADAESLLRMQFSAHEAHLHAHHASARFAIITRDSEAIGRMVWASDAEEIHLVDLALVSEARGQGTGTALLEALIRHADSESQSIRLTVRNDNPARALYLRMGFEERGTTELDVLMTRSARSGN